MSKACGLILYSFSVGMYVMDQQLERYFSLGAAYRADADPQLAINHHREEQLKMAAYVKALGKAMRDAAATAAG